MENQARVAESNLPKNSLLKGGKRGLKPGSSAFGVFFFDNNLLFLLASFLGH